jgi:cbb3-type cytochrome oxidase maturation protein
MNILIVMIPLSILLLVGAGIAFFWAVDHDQFEDMDTPRLLPLLDNPDAPANAPTAGPTEGTSSRPVTPSGIHVGEAPQARQAAATERDDSP